MTHGWPGSVVELLETVGPLTDPTAHGGRAEERVPPRAAVGSRLWLLRRANRAGLGPVRVATAWGELMPRLGYTRYVAQGGDVGAAVTDAMACQAPAGLIGVHMNLLVTALAPGAHPSETEEERAAVKALATFQASGFGYYLEQSTRPQTIGYALLDSPVPVPAAWMLDHDTDSYLKIVALRQQGTDRQPQRQRARQHCRVLAHRHGRLGRAVVLGARPRAGGRGRPDAGAGGGSRRLHTIPGRDLPRRRRAAGSNRATRTSCTSTRPSAAATSRPGKSPTPLRRTPRRLSLPALSLVFPRPVTRATIVI